MNTLKILPKCLITLHSKHRKADNSILSWSTKDLLTSLQLLPTPTRPIIIFYCATVLSVLSSCVSLRNLSRSVVSPLPRRAVLFFSEQQCCQITCKSFLVQSSKIPRITIDLYSLYFVNFLMPLNVVLVRGLKGSRN